MNKKRFAIIAHPLLDNIILFIQKRLNAIAKVDADFYAKDILPQDFDFFMTQASELDGYMLRSPYKQQVMQYMDNLSRKSRLYGSVDTVLNNYLVEGHTTEADAFLKAIKSNGIELAGRVVIYGMGSMARTLAFECTIVGADTCLVSNAKRLTKAARLSGEIKDSFHNWDVSTCLIDHMEEEDIDILVNTSSKASLECPIASNILKRCKYVFDTTYNPFETELQKKASKHGAISISGLYMLICHCALSNQIWNKYIFSDTELLQIFEECKELQNKGKL